MIDFDRIGDAPVSSEPFAFLTAGGTLSQADLAAIRADFPRIDKPGIFPLSALEYGPAFARLVEDIRSPQLAKVLGAKFGVDLDGLPLMITVRGQAQAKDGRIHTDSKDKVVTVLLYLNENWDESGGRLRMLRGPDDLGDFAAEVPPSGGTLAAFKVGPNSWHGHEPFVGQRRYVMFNWVQSEAALSRNIGRHRLSAAIKKLIPSFYTGA